MLDEQGNQATPKVVEFAKNKFRRVQSTQCVEDAFNRQKTFQSKGYSYHYSRPERSMAAPIVKKVLSQVHHYDEVQPRMAGAFAGKTLSRNCFTPSGKPSGWSASQVAGHRQTPEWHSPGAQNSGLVFADLAVMAEVRAENRWHLLGNAWLGVLVSATHDVLFRRADKPNSPWLFGVTSFPKSACVFWPAEVTQIKQCRFIAQPSTTNRELIMHPILDLGDWEAWRFEWASPVRVFKEFGVAQKDQARPGVRACLLGKAAPLLAVSARCGFFTLAKSSLDSLCQHLGCSKGDSLFESLLNLLSAALPKSPEQELLKIAESRVGAMQAQGGGRVCRSSFVWMTELK